MPEQRLASQRTKSAQKAHDCPNSSNIKETFEETLNVATDSLIEQLLDHLTLVAEEAQSEALMDKQRMNQLTQRCRAGELVNHERYLSATEANIKRHENRNRQDTERKLRELAGRPERKEDFPTIEKRNNIYDRRRRESRRSTSTPSGSQEQQRPPPIPNPPTRKKQLPPQHGKAKRVETFISLINPTASEQPGTSGTTRESEKEVEHREQPPPKATLPPRPPRPPRPPPTPAIPSTSSESTQQQRQTGRTQPPTQLRSQRIQEIHKLLTTLHKERETTIESENPENMQEWEQAIQQPLVTVNQENSPILNISS